MNSIFNSMLYSAINIDGKLHILLHVEQVYQNFNRFNHNLGYFTSELTLDTTLRVEEEIKLGLNFNSIIIDCNLLEESRNSNNEFLRIFDYCKERNFSFSIIRIQKNLYSDLQCHAVKLKHNLFEEIDTNSNCFNLFSNKESSINYENFDRFIYDYYGNTILHNGIRDKYWSEKIPDYSDSSNVRLPKYINIKKFIEDTEVSFLGLYLLCKKAVELSIIPRLNNSQNRPIAFFQSIIGGYLASIISKIAIMDIAYFDHIGPISKIYKTVQKNSFLKNNNYILISDVICMGTEIQIAKNIIEHEHSNVVGLMSIVEVEVIDKPKKGNNCSLFTLTNKNNDEIKYKILTNFANE